MEQKRMLYVITVDRSGDSWNLACTESLNRAIEIARCHLARLSEHDRKRTKACINGYFVPRTIINCFDLVKYLIDNDIYDPDDFVEVKYY